MPDNKIYLGDGAYAEFLGFGVSLTTTNGLTTTNEVVLEPYMIEDLYQFYKAHVKPKVDK